MVRRSIELFAGAGGLGIGLAQAGFVPNIVLERDKWCCDTLRENHGLFGGFSSAKLKGSWLIEEADIRDVSFSSFADSVDLVSGGPPCQPFSLGGRHRANRDNRDMFPEAVRAIREIRPRAFVFENVKGLTRSSFLPYFEYIKLQLEHPEVKAFVDESWEDHLVRLERHHSSTKREGLNYNVVANLLNAANFGVPQKRERVVFVGFRDDVDARWSFGSSATHSKEALVWDQVFGTYWERHGVPKSERIVETQYASVAKRLSRSEKPKEAPWRTTRDAIHDLPDPQICSTRIPDHRFQVGARTYPGHTGSFIDAPAKTLKAGVHGVPGGENMLRRSDGSVRYFTVRESARLQNFPDNYRFHGAWSECMRQLGNAVPVDLAKAVGEAVSSHLDAA